MINQQIYDFGDVARMTVEFRVDGVLTDPTTISATVKKPDGTVTVYTTLTVLPIVRDSQGVYHLDVPANQPGTWTFKFAGTGAAEDIGTNSFYVQPDPTVTDPNLYVTLAELKSTSDLGDLDYADADLLRSIKAACQGIDQVCNRTFKKDTMDVVRYYTPADPSMVIIDDLVTLTELATDQNFSGAFDMIWTVNSQFFLSPLNNDLQGFPFTRIELKSGWQVSRVFPSWSNRSVRVTGRFGWPAVPVQVSEAATIIATKLAKRKREAPFGIVTSALDQGVAARVTRNDPEVMFLLDSYRREIVP